MSNKRFIIKGKFTGYYIAGEQLKGYEELFKINFKNIEINSYKNISNYRVDELKTGNFLELGDLESFTLPKKVDVRYTLLKDVILKNIKVVKSIKSDDKIYVKAEGEIYAKGPAIPIKEEPKIEINQKKKREEKPKGDSYEFEYDKKSKPESEQSNYSDDNSSRPISENGGCDEILNNNRFTKKPFQFFEKSWFNRANRNYRTDNITSNNRGCFTLLLFLAGLFFLITAFGASPLINSISLGLFGLFLIMASLIPKFRGFVGTVLGMLTFLYVMGSLLSYFTNFINEDWWQQDWVEQRSEEELEWDKERQTEEVVEQDDQSIDNDKKIAYYQHNHNWKENSGDKRNSKFRVRKEYYKISLNQRNVLQANINNANQYWNKVYSSLIQNDRGKLDEICKMYQKIGVDNNLNYNQFADMVVTSVQWIPYVLVLEKSCEESKYDGGFVTEYLLSGKPCLGNIKFGIQSPVEFMSNFKGDCDTRAVMCFLVLDKFGYDVAVLVSEKYGHAILGININSGGGDYVKHKGKRYYVWETTATGFKVGNIPPACSNLRYWKPALTNN